MGCKVQACAWDCHVEVFCDGPTFKKVCQEGGDEVENDKCEDDVDSNLELAGDEYAAI